MACRWAMADSSGFFVGFESRPIRECVASVRISEKHGDIFEVVVHQRRFVRAKVKAKHAHAVIFEFQFEVRGILLARVTRKPLRYIRMPPNNSASTASSGVEPKFFRECLIGSLQLTVPAL